MNHKKQEQKLKDLQLTLEKLDYKNNLQKIEKAHKDIALLQYNEAHKIKLENGLYINSKILDDSRNREWFYSLYDKHLMYFQFENPEKTEQDFIENKIEVINLKLIEEARICNLSDDEYYYELSKRKEISDHKKHYLNEYKDTTEEEIKSKILSRYPRTEPSEFEDWHLTLYKRKLKELPNYNATKTAPIKKPQKPTLKPNFDDIDLQIDILVEGTKKIFVSNKEQWKNLFSKNIIEFTKPIELRKGTTIQDLRLFLDSLKHNDLIKKSGFNKIIEESKAFIFDGNLITANNLKHATSGNYPNTANSDTIKETFKSLNIED